MLIKQISDNEQKVLCESGFILIKDCICSVKLYQLNGFGVWLDSILLSSLFDLLVKHSSFFSAKELWDEAVINTIRKQTGIDRLEAKFAYEYTQSIDDAINYAKTRKNYW